MNKKIVLMLVVAMSTGAFTQMAVAQAMATPSVVGAGPLVGAGAGALLNPGAGATATDPEAKVSAKVDAAKANVAKAQSAVDSAQVKVAKAQANINPVPVGGDLLTATDQVSATAKKAAVKYAPAPTAVQKAQVQQTQQALTLVGGGDKLQ